MTENKGLVDKLIQALRAVEAEDEPAKEEVEVAKPKPVKKVVKNNGYTNRQMQLLTHIANKGTVTVENLKQDFSRSKGSLNRMLNILVDGGAIEYTRTRPRVYSVKGLGESYGNKWTEQVLQYISDNDGKRYSLQQMGKEIGMPDGVIYGTVHRLQKRGLVAKDFNLGEATAPQEGEKQPDVPTPDSKEEATQTPQEDNLLKQIEFLVWTYVRENRDTDVLKFLTWLETK